MTLLELRQEKGLNKNLFLIGFPFELTKPSRCNTHKTCNILRLKPTEYHTVMLQKPLKKIETGKCNEMVLNQVMSLKIM